MCPYVYVPYFHCKPVHMSAARNACVNSLYTFSLNGLDICIQTYVLCFKKINVTHVKTYRHVGMYVWLNYALPYLPNSYVLGNYD